MKNIGIKLVTLGLLATTVLAPMSANADVHRQDNKNDLIKVVVGVLNRDVRFDNDRKDNDRDRRDDRDSRDQRDNQDNDRREVRNDNRGRR